MFWAHDNFPVVYQSFPYTFNVGVRDDSSTGRDGAAAAMGVPSASILTRSFFSLRRWVFGCER